jgi:hypothetical protein
MDAPPVPDSVASFRFSHCAAGEKAAKDAIQKAVDDAGTIPGPDAPQVYRATTTAFINGLRGENLVLVAETAAVVAAARRKSNDESKRELVTPDHLPSSLLAGWTPTTKKNGDAKTSYRRYAGHCDACSQRMNLNRISGVGRLPECYTPGCVNCLR